MDETEERSGCSSGRSGGMTVRELIQSLQEQPQDLEVILYADHIGSLRTVRLSKYFFRNGLPTSVVVLDEEG